MDCSIIICTHNRADCLKQSLRAVLHQEYNLGKLEVLVVDNCSTDHTRQATESLTNDSCHPVRYIYEPKPGLTNARNSGVEHSQGEVVVFIDDDAFPRKRNWAQQLAQVYRDPQISAAGGDLEPVWPTGQRPRWIHDLLLHCLGLTTFELTKVTELHHPFYPWGANISYRRSSVQSLNGFHPHLGRVGKDLISGEESELCLRLEKAGKKVVYVSDAVVDHVIAPERLTKTWFKKRALSQGRTDARIDRLHIAKLQILPVLIRKILLILALAAGKILFPVLRLPKLARLCDFKILVSWSYILVVNSKNNIAERT